MVVWNSDFEYDQQADKESCSSHWLHRMSCRVGPQRTQAPPLVAAPFDQIIPLPYLNRGYSRHQRFNLFVCSAVYDKSFRLPRARRRSNTMMCVQKCKTTVVPLVPFAKHSKTKQQKYVTDCRFYRSSENTCTSTACPEQPSTNKSSVSMRRPPPLLPIWVALA